MYNATLTEGDLHVILLALEELGENVQNEPREEADFVTDTTDAVKGAMKALQAATVTPCVIGFDCGGESDVTVVNIDGSWGDVQRAKVLRLTDAQHDELCEGTEIHQLEDVTVVATFAVNELGA